MSMNSSKKSKRGESMKVKYNREDDVLLVEVSDEKIDYAEEEGNMIIHFSKDGKPVLIEILDASEFLTEIMKASMKGVEVQI